MKRLLILFSFLSVIARGADAPAQHYVIFFSYDSKKPSEAHTFATFVADSGANESPKPFTISWLPETGKVRPLALVKGHNFTMRETYRIAGQKTVISDGPYRITPNLYEKAWQQHQLLNSGVVKYKMYDWRTRSLNPENGNVPTALNCIHAVSNISGFFDTADRWGTEVTREIRDRLVSQGAILGYPRKYPAIAQRVGIPGY